MKELHCIYDMNITVYTKKNCIVYFTRESSIKVCYFYAQGSTITSFEFKVLYDEYDFYHKIQD